MRYKILIIVLLLFVFEIYLKKSKPTIHEADTQLGWKLKRNLNLDIKQKTAFKKKYNVNFKTNDRGSRYFGDEVNSDIKILVMGDSFTNMHYASNDKMWFSILAKEIEKKINKKIYIEAIGAGGFSNYQQYLLSKEITKSFDPDLVFLQMCGNDFFNNLYKWEKRLFVRNQYTRRPFLVENKTYFYNGWLKKFYNSSLFENIRIINRVDLLLTIIQSRIYFYFSNKKNNLELDLLKNESVDITDKILSKIKELFIDKEIFVFTCSNDERFPYNKWYDLALKNNMKPLKIFDDFDYNGDIYFKDKGHFNELGNYRVGMSLFSNLIKNYKIY